MVSIAAGRAGAISRAIRVTRSAGIGEAIVTSFEFRAHDAITARGTRTGGRTVHVTCATRIGVAIITSFKFRTGFAIAAR